MKGDLAAFLRHTHSNLRASLPHHLQVQDQSEQIVLFFQIKSQGTKTPECLDLGEMPSDRSATAWFSSEGVVLDLRVPSNNIIMQSNSHKKSTYIGPTNYQQLPVPAPELPVHWTCKGSLHICWDACNWG